MIGIIITGHNKFASGIESSLKLLAGPQEKLTSVDFLKGMSPEELQNKFSQIVKNNGDTEGTIFFTDIPGGTPFNQAVTYKTNHRNVSVIGGTNIPMLMEILFKRNESLDEVTNKAVDSGKNSITSFKIKENRSRSSSNDNLDGI